MLNYIAVPILIIIGLCISSYILGRYVRIEKKQKLKEPDRVPVLEKENKNLKESLEIKSKELEKKNEAYDLVMRENQKFLAQTPSESTGKIDNRKKETENAVKSEEPIKIESCMPQPGDGPAAIDPAVHTVSSLYEAVLKGPAEKTKVEKPGAPAEGEKPVTPVKVENPEKKEKC